MSDALDYLLKVRSDAIPHYFKFLKETGKHLDPKTRALISVIAKVYAQTETGLRQHVTHLQVFVHESVMVALWGGSQSSAATEGWGSPHGFAQSGLDRVS